MFSGKSTELLRRMRRYAIAGKETLVLKYDKDVRYADVSKLATHDRVTHDAFPVARLGDVPADVINAASVIGIDEGQFFPDLLEWTRDAVSRLGKVVVIAALDGTFQRVPFGDVCALIPFAETVSKLSAVCSTCGADAPFTARISAEKEIEVIGGADKYSAVCRACFDQMQEQAKVSERTPKLESFFTTKSAAPTTVGRA
jgi:thymidine kinase